MEQTLDGRAAAAKHPPSTHAFHHGGHSSTKSYPPGVSVGGGYYPPGNAAMSSKHPAPRHSHHAYHGDGHHAKVKADAPMVSGGAYYAPPSSLHPSMQPPYNPNVVHANSGNGYYNPHVINPPLPPLPPTNPAPSHPVSTPSAAYSKPSQSDSFQRPAQDATYHRPQHNANHHHHPSSNPPPSSTSHSMEHVKCHRCGDKGHIAPSCPARRPHHHTSYSKHLPRTCKYWLNGNCHKGDDCTFVHALVPDANGHFYPPPHMLRHPHQGMYPPPIDQTFYFAPPPPMPQHHLGYGYDTSAHHVASPPLGSDEGYDYQQPSDMYPGPNVPQPGYGGAPYYPYDNTYAHYQYPSQQGQRYAAPPAPTSYHPQQQPPPPPPHHHAAPTYPNKMYNYAQPYSHASPRDSYAQPFPTYPEVQPPFNPPPAHASPDSFDAYVDEVSNLTASFSEADIHPTTSDDAAEGAADAAAIPPTAASPTAVPGRSLAVEIQLPVDDAPTEPAASKSSATSPTDASANKATKKKKKTKPTVVTSSAPAPLTEKGLRNDTGENNCFLNVVVQALFHLETFQSRWAHTTASAHVCAGDGRCVYCALSTVFARLADGRDGENDQDGAVSSDLLRKVLSAISTSPLPAAEERYKAGSMDDAAEAHETILRSLHESLTSSSLASPCTCLAHDVFGLWVGEEAVCAQCRKSMATPPYDAMVLHVATEAIKDATKAKAAAKAKRFEDLLATVWATAGSSKKCTACLHDKVYESRLQLKQVPRVFTIGMTWKNNSANMATLKAIVTSMEPSLRLGRVFPNMVAEGRLAGPDDGEATLLAMYCFYGHHYMAFIYKAATKEWLSFNDTVVRRVGTQWSDVQAACLENHYQPYVLFYDVAPTKKADSDEQVLQFTIGDFVMSVASEVDRENWKATDNEAHDVAAPVTAQTRDRHQPLHHHPK